MKMLYLSIVMLTFAGLMFLLRFVGVWEWFNPSRMDILNLVLALGGIALGMPSTIQMFCGKPKIILGVGKREAAELTTLIGEIFNYPHSSKFLNKLGVRTEPAQDVWANFKIVEHGTRRQVFTPPLLPSIYTYAGPESQRAVIPASAVPGVFRIAVIDKEKKKVFAYESEQELLPGLYIVAITVGVGTDEYVMERNIQILNTYPYAAWVS